jgi:DNA-binding beta-propeller fold protein YncE
MSIKPKLLGAVLVSFSVVHPALADGTVYVPMGGANEILVIDIHDDKVVDRIPGIANAHGLAGTPDGTLLIAGSIVGIDKAKGEMPTKPAGMSEDEHNSHHGGSKSKATSADISFGLLTVISASDKSIIRKVETAGPIHHTLVTPDGRYAVSTLLDDAAISVVDLKTFENIKTIKTGPVPNYAVASTDGKFVYVSNSGNATVSEIATESWQVTRVFVLGNGPEHMVMATDDKTLYVNNTGDGTVSAVSLADGMTTQSYAIGGELHGTGLSDDGQTLFVIGRENETLSAINLKTGLKRNVPLQPSPYHLTVIKGTGKMYVSSAEDNKLWVVDQKTLKATGEIPLSDRAHQMVVVN